MADKDTRVDRRADIWPGPRFLEYRQEILRYEEQRRQQRRQAQAAAEQARRYYSLPPPNLTATSIVKPMSVGPITQPWANPGYDADPGPLPRALVAGPIIAWRVWKIRHDGILLSVTRSTSAWPPGAPLIGDPHQPNEGVYAVKARNLLLGHAYGQDCVPGQVALWGMVIEHEHGYRAQFAYPVMVDLSAPVPMPGFPKSPKRTALAQAIRDWYGIEVRE